MLPENKMGHPMSDNTEAALNDLLPKLRRRARRLARTAEEAEDMVQETALRIWQVMEGPDAIETPERYAMTTLHNLARQRWRQRKPTEELTDDMAQDAPLAPARLACADLRSAIARLPEDQAKLMKLVLSGETSPRVLAARLGIPKGTVMSRLARARARLREEMGLGQRGSVADLL